MADVSNNRVMHWAPGAVAGTIVAGLVDEWSWPSSSSVTVYYKAQHFIGVKCPFFVALAPDGGVVAADLGKHSVTHWAPGAAAAVAAAAGTLVARDTWDDQLQELLRSLGLALAFDGGVVVVDSYNHRGDVAGTVEAGRHGLRAQLEQLNHPWGDQVPYPWGVAETAAAWIWTPWHHRIHLHWDAGSHQTVVDLLLCQRRWSHDGLSPLKELLMTRVLPYLMPRRLVYVGSSNSLRRAFLMTTPLSVAAVIEEVDHVEDATAIAPIEAVVLQNPQALSRW